MGVISGVSGVFFWLSVRKLDREEDKLNYLKKGEFLSQGKHVNAN
jgi:proton-dependent oligopeptide transporter, POT family